MADIQIFVESDAEAIDKADDLKNGSNLYPVHFSISDTSGEKHFEEHLFKRL